MAEVRNQITDVRGQKSDSIKNNLFSVVCLLFSVFCFLFLPSNLRADQWKELKGEHFIIYFHEDEKFAKEVLNKAEIYYKEIAVNLGYQRYSNFWLWDKRCKIYLYSEHNSFIEATHSPNWSHGQANYTKKTVSGYVQSQQFLNSILPHELGHLIFRDFVGFKGEIPLWLDEGVAQWQERAKPQIVKDVVAKLLKEDKLILLKEMMELDIRRVKDEEFVHIFYAESASLVDFLIRRYGTTKFTIFCRQLRDGKTLEEALKFSYPVSIRTIESLDKKWKKYLLEE